MASSSEQASALASIRRLRKGGSRASAEYDADRDGPSNVLETVTEDAYKEIVKKRKSSAAGFVEDEDDEGEYSDDGEEFWDKSASLEGKQSKDTARTDRIRNVAKSQAKRRKAARPAVGMDSLVNHFEKGAPKLQAPVASDIAAVEALEHELTEQAPLASAGGSQRMWNSLLQSKAPGRTSGAVNKPAASWSMLHSELHTQTARAFPPGSTRLAATRLGLSGDAGQLLRMQRDLAAALELRTGTAPDPPPDVPPCGTDEHQSSTVGPDEAVVGRQGATHSRDAPTPSPKRMTEAPPESLEAPDSGRRVAAPPDAEEPSPSIGSGLVENLEAFATEAGPESGQGEPEGAQPAGAAVGSSLAPYLLPQDDSAAQVALPFYLLDACEDHGSPATVFLFGKITNQTVSGSWESCCVRVQSMERVVFFRARRQPTENDECGPICKEIHDEVNEIRKKYGIPKFKDKGVRRHYAFEQKGIPREKHQLFLKVKYSAQYPPIGSDVKGEAFTHVLGSTKSLLELLFVKRRIKGPQWLLIRGFREVSDMDRKSWCKKEVVVNSSKEIFTWKTAGFKDTSRPQDPHLSVFCLAVKTVLNQRRQHEIHVVAGRMKKACDIDSESIDFPSTSSNTFMGVWSNTVPSDSDCKGVSFFASEKALLTVFLAKFQEFDPDVIVGHNLFGFDLEILSSRLQISGLQIWHKLSRLRRPKHKLKSGSSSSLFVARNLTLGRLVCDTYLQAREHLSSRPSYSLASVVEFLLKGAKPPPAIPCEEVEAHLNNPKGIEFLAKHTLNGAYLSGKVAWALRILRLTKELTCIGGNLWYGSLQNSRSERNEWLLLHRFHEEKYICPDPLGPMTRKKTETPNEGTRRGGDDEEQPEEDHADQGQPGPSKRSPAYEGGLVFEPKVGFYDTFVLLLDFNSLYPSIIQEFNICFTTVKRPSGEQSSNFEATEIAKSPGILPEVLHELVKVRKNVKNTMKQETDPRKLAAQEIRQLALKLTANSIYGCLGFRYSRFAVRSLAALITQKGRTLLESTRAKIERDFPTLEVLYGDTDSVMIDTRLPDDGNGTNYANCLAIAEKVKRSINSSHRLLELDLDGIFKRLLLLKKKKYACVKVIDYNNRQFKSDMKGIDIVRRDWSGLTKGVGEAILGQMFSDRPLEDVVESIHDILRSVAKDVDDDKVPAERFVITKSVTKPLDSYADAKNQMHVQVARRMQDRGMPITVGLEIPFIVCVEAASSMTSEPDASRGKTSVAERAWHPDEVEKKRLTIDKEWYKSQQLLPPTQRLCGHIQGTDSRRLADCLGLEASKHGMQASRGQTAPYAGDAFELRGFSDEGLTDVVLEESYPCPHCDECAHADSFFRIIGCPKCGVELPAPLLQNWLRLILRRLLVDYSALRRTCSDCGTETSRVLLSSGTRCPSASCANPSSLTAACPPEGLHRALEGLVHMLNKPLPTLVSGACTEDGRAALRTALADTVPDERAYSSSRVQTQVQLRECLTNLLRHSKYHHVSMKLLFSVFAAS